MLLVKRVAIILSVVSLMAIALGTAQYDPGGLVVEYAAKAAVSTGKRISGFCASACTMYLSSRRVCIYSSTEFVFHAATTPIGTRILLMHYTPALREWLRLRGGLTVSPIHATGAELISLGYRQCK